MSDRVYKDVRSFGVNGSLNPGAFAKRQFKINAVPTVGQTTTITWNGVTRTYEYTDDASVGANYGRYPNVNLVKVLIGPDISSTHKNLVTAINSNYMTTQGGRDTTIIASETLNGTDSTVLLHSNAKITGSITIGGVAQTNVANTAGAAFDGYSTLTNYKGISVTTGSCSLIIRNDEEGADNAGPPINGLKMVTVTIPTNRILPIETFGCSVACTVYR